MSKDNPYCSSTQKLMYIAGGENASLNCSSSQTVQTIRAPAAALSNNTTEEAA